MLPPKTGARTCLACDSPLKGRSDKKYCDDYCRNNYNNRLKAADSGLQRLINSALAKNKRILQSMLSPDKETVKTTRDKLLLNGFSFKYLTHTYMTRKGSTYYYCYEFGYLPLNNEDYLIVKKKEN